MKKNKPEQSAPIPPKTEGRVVMTLKVAPDQVRTDQTTIYEVTDIAGNDIRPSASFLAFVQEQKDFPFLNRFTMNDFTNQVREQYASKSEEGVAEV